MPQITPIRGFTNTPTTKSICLVTTLLAVLLSILRLKQVVKLTIDPHIIEYSQYWRLATYQLSVVNESDYLLVVGLWFYYKNLERFYGSRKYLSVITIFAIYNSLVCFLIMTLGQLASNLISYLVDSVFSALGGVSYHTTIFNEAISGPLGIVSSLYVCYREVIPTSYNFKIVFRNPYKVVEESDSLLNESRRSSLASREITLTSHFPIHLMFNVLLLNNGFKSIIPCLTGLLIGKLHTNDLLPGSKTWLIPQFVFRLLVNPVKLIQTSFGNLRISLSRRAGYQSLASPVNEVAGEEDVDEDFVDGRNTIRAETPVRPLGSQFLDTFRN